MNKQKTSSDAISLLTLKMEPSPLVCEDQDCYQMAQDIASCEAGLHDIIRNPQAKTSLFLSENEGLEFFLVYRNSLQGCYPVDVADALYRDTPLRTTACMGNLDLGWNKKEMSEAMRLAYVEEGSFPRQGNQFLPSNYPLPLSTWDNSVDRKPSKILQCDLKYSLLEDSFQFAPLLSMAAMKMSGMKSEGTPYYIQTPIAELIGRGHLSRQEAFAPVKLSVDMGWKEMLSMEPLPCFVSQDDVLDFLGCEGENLMRAVRLRDLGIFFPFTVWKQDKNQNPTFLLGRPQQKMPLWGLNRLLSAERVIVTEHLPLAIANSEYPDVAFISWLGREAGLSKSPQEGQRRTDLSPLLKRKFSYLLVKGDNEEDGKRAAKVALDFLSGVSALGFTHFDVLDVERNVILAENELDELAEAYGVELPINLTGPIDLQWPARKDIGELIVGETIDTGRLTLFHASHGVGKTMLALLVSEIANRGRVPDGCDCSGPLAFNGEKCRVLYVQQEMADQDITSRQESIARAFSGEKLPEALYAYCPDGELTDEQHWNAMLKKMRELDPNGDSKWIVVIDNILSLMRRAAYQKGYAQMRPRLDALKRLGVTVILVNHDQKGGENYGTSDILNHADYSWHITDDDGYHGKNGSKQVNVRIDKHRHRAPRFKCFSIAWQINEKTSQFIVTTGDDGGNTTDSPEPAQAKLPSANAMTDEPQEPEDDQHLGSVDGTEDTWRSLTLCSLKAFLKDKKRTDEEKRNLLCQLRAGRTLKEVAEQLGCSEQTVLNYCKKFGATRQMVEDYEYSQLTGPAPPLTTCKRGSPGMPSKATFTDNDGKTQRRKLGREKALCIR